MKYNFTVGDIISSSIKIGAKNSASLLVAIILWIITIWIPYVNVGTTIGLIGLSVDLGKDKKIDPMSIFDASHRKIMGNMFLLFSLSFTGILIGLLFFYVPALVLSYAWMFGALLVLDKKLTPLEALNESYELTYGHKWSMFFALLLSGLLFYFLMMIALLIPESLSYRASAFEIFLSFLPFICIYVIFIAVQMTMVGYMYASGLKKKKG